MARRKNKTVGWVRLIVGALFLIGGIAGGLYVGFWLMMVKPIMSACAAFDAGNLTATIVGMTVLKFVFGGTVGSAIFAIGSFIGGLFVGN